MSVSVQFGTWKNRMTVGYGLGSVTALTDWNTWPEPHGYWTFNMQTKGVYITKRFKGLLALPAWAEVNNFFKHLKLLKVKWSLLKNRQFKFVYSFVYFNGASWSRTSLSTKLRDTNLSVGLKSNWAQTLRTKSNSPKPNYPFKTYK